MIDWNMKGGRREEEEEEGTGCGNDTKHIDVCEPIFSL
jgi:hypothetical protein